MEINYNIIQWLLAGDPAIRWQTMRDLVHAREEIVGEERRLVAESGWGAKLLSFQESSGQWGRGIYSPKWISTTYTMLLLRQLGLPPKNPQALLGCKLLLEKGFYSDSGINYFASMKHSETCVTGMVLSIIAYFQYDDERIDKLVEFLLAQQMTDGGWNCQSFNGASHSSFHTTISVLEGLRAYEKLNRKWSSQAHAAQAAGREFLLVHRLYKSHRTGAVVKPAFTRFSFPPRWYYDVLRALDYFQECAAERDERLIDAIEVLLKKRKHDGCWQLQNRHPGVTFFELEQVGAASRWNTLRALRVLQWWHSPISAKVDAC